MLLKFEMIEHIFTQELGMTKVAPESLPKYIQEALKPWLGYGIYLTPCNKHLIPMVAWWSKDDKWDRVVESTFNPGLANIGNESLLAYPIDISMRNPSKTSNLLPFFMLQQDLLETYYISLGYLPSDLNSLEGLILNNVNGSKGFDSRYYNPKYLNGAALSYETIDLLHKGVITGLNQSEYADIILKGANSVTLVGLDKEFLERLMLRHHAIVFKYKNLAHDKVWFIDFPCDKSIPRIAISLQLRKLMSSHPTTADKEKLIVDAIREVIPEARFEVMGSSTPVIVIKYEEKDAQKYEALVHNVLKLQGEADGA